MQSIYNIITISRSKREKILMFILRSLKKKALCHPQTTIWCSVKLLWNDVYRETHCTNKFDFTINLSFNFNVCCPCCSTTCSQTPMMMNILRLCLRRSEVCCCVWVRTRRKYKSVFEMQCKTLLSRRHTYTQTHALTSDGMSQTFKDEMFFKDLISRFLKRRRHAWDYEGVFLMQHQRSGRLKYKSLSWRINWDVKENSFVIFPFLRVFSHCVSFFPENRWLHKSTSYAAQHQER